MKDLIHLFCAIVTTVIGWNIHGSIFYCICNFIFWPFAWLYWLLTKSVTLEIIKQSFNFFFE